MDSEIERSALLALCLHQTKLNSKKKTLTERKKRKKYGYRNKNVNKPTKEKNLRHYFDKTKQPVFVKNWKMIKQLKALSIEGLRIKLFLNLYGPLKRTKGMQI